MICVEDALKVKVLALCYVGMSARLVHHFQVALHTNRGWYGLSPLVRGVIEAGVTQIHPSHGGFWFSLLTTVVAVVWRSDFSAVDRALASWQVVLHASLKPCRNLDLHLCGSCRIWSA